MSLLALQDLFRRYRDRATGVWKLGQEPSRTIYFDYGDTVFAQSTHLADRLTTILVERGRITQAQMDYALANLKPGISIGKNLIEMGFITQRDLLDVAKIQVERIIFGCLGQPDVLPVFEARELDAHVVRLPLNTAQLLLGGMLAIQNRESLLELLGPLNQVVVLQGRSLLDLSLPPDLGRLTSLLDGTHTLLELSREAQAEPMRVGAFALFLREMGWARLHEMPPVDRQALDLALSPEPEPLSEPLPEPPAEVAPSLFETIQEAARPTTNLEHLSQALDEVPPPAPEPLYLPDNLQLPGIPDPAPEPDVHAETGQAELPTPSVELPPLPEAVEEAPRVLLTVPPGEAPEELPPPEPEMPASSSLRWPVVGLVLAACLLGGFFLMRRRGRASVPKPLPGEPVKAEPAKPPVEPAPSIAVPPAPEPPKAEPAEPPKAEPKAEPKPELKPAAKPEPKPEPKAKPIGASISERLEALRKGDLTRAVAQGAQRVKEAPAGHFSLRLEIACQGETIRRVPDLFRDGKPDLFLLPMTLRDGRTCYQILYGNFPSKEAAEREAKRLPPAFQAEKDRPRVFRFTEIPKEQ
ncbi:DUF4388 domain-containing protein [Mesoterricola silvestris]|uniref:PatA-like N-terminal domain-containing protein n=1 Tax=Mesoterricola silvestris TaxID=2927979 RepID=A0AA48GPF3_9BACT|nr:hypothetical protein [Mesoterricola silvestris]BDU71730.1 hypothetical protein METEAL_09040 [Mesoterricola silvestris]